MRDEDGLGLQLEGGTGEKSVRYLGDKIVRMEFIEHLLKALCAQVLEQWVRRASSLPPWNGCQVFAGVPAWMAVPWLG